MNEVRPLHFIQVATSLPVAQLFEHLMGVWRATGLIPICEVEIIIF